MTIYIYICYLLDHGTIGVTRTLLCLEMDGGCQWLIFLWLEMGLDFLQMFPGHLLRRNTIAQDRRGCSFAEMPSWSSLLNQIMLKCSGGVSISSFNPGFHFQIDHRICKRFSWDCEQLLQPFWSHRTSWGVSSASPRHRSTAGFGVSYLLRTRPDHTGGTPEGHRTDFQRSGDGLRWWWQLAGWSVVWSCSNDLWYLDKAWQSMTKLKWYPEHIPQWSCNQRIDLSLGFYLMIKGTYIESVRFSFAVLFSCIYS